MGHNKAQAKASLMKPKSKRRDAKRGQNAEPEDAELIRDLQELKRFIDHTILTVECGGLRTDPNSSSAPFDMIFGGKWGITKLSRKVINNLPPIFN